VARLPSSDAMRRMADGWVDAERGMAQAVAFYAQAALQRPGELYRQGDGGRVNMEVTLWLIRGETLKQFRVVYM